MGLFSSDKFKCARCGREGEPLGYAPVPTELGKKIGREICKSCWREWLQKQTQIINHFGIDVSDPNAHEFLFDQMRIFFYDEGVDLKQIDESKQGTVKW